MSIQPSHKNVNAQSVNTLVTWYEINKRPLPWRQNRNPYFIWISEVMLQQTTVAAVRPYFERFIVQFPTVQDLANSSLEDLYSAWAGLGYYSRARNLHAAAQVLAVKGFPKTADQLIELKGFGPYTSRAVASIAFGDRVGVLDGNVIRVLSRYLDFKAKWWNLKDRKILQSVSDQIAQFSPPEKTNQALMELGATICTPKNPTCLLCPWQNSCQGFKNGTVLKLPLKKPKKESEVWVWTPLVKIRDHKIAVQKNNYLPFLKGQWVFPGVIKKEKTKPKSYDLKHGITHHDIYIKLSKKLNLKSQGLKINSGDIKWVEIKNLSKLNPSSVLQKIISAQTNSRNKK